MRILGDLATSGSLGLVVPTVCWTLVQLTRIVLRHRWECKVLERTPDDQVSTTVRALSTAQRSQRK